MEDMCVWHCFHMEVDSHFHTGTLSPVQLSEHEDGFCCIAGPHLQSGEKVENMYR